MDDFFAFEPDPNRQRYELIIKRRQALLEVGKLRHAIQEHTRWAEELESDNTLSAILEQQLFNLDELLCQHFCQADSDALHVDLQNIYVYIVKLAKIWLALEKKDAIQPVMQRQFG